MRMALYDTGAVKRPVNLTLNGDLVTRARAEGLNLSALAEEAVAAALARRARERLDADIAQACRVHDQYLAEYGSLGEAVRTSADAAG
jgi:post-segregation antitoxin (ccd killing protein)